MTTEVNKMSNILFDYDHNLVQQHIDDLRRDAARARFARGVRRNRRQRRQESSAHRTLRAQPAR
jgi:hypothetical protein